MKKLKTLSEYKYLLFLTIIFISLIRCNTLIKSTYKESNTYFKGTIISYKEKDNYLTFTIKGKEKLKCNYYYRSNNKINLSYGDTIYLKGNLTKPTNNTIPNTFNYKNYLNNNKINYILEVDKIIKIKKTNNILFKIKNIIEKRINKIDKLGYLNAFILGNKDDIDKDIYKTYLNNGIVHIFSISGMHISLLSGILLFVLNKIKKKKYNILIVITFLIFYLIITNYQASITRSIIFFTLLNIFKLKKINISTLDTLLISISIILIIYPNFINNIGFMYSSAVSFSLIYYKNLFNKNYILNTLLISFVSFLISLPITVNINYSVNLLSIIINIIFVPLISFIIYPLSLLTFIFPYLYNIFEKLILLCELISSTLSNIKLFIIPIPKLNFITILIYYILIYLLLSKNKKYILLLVLYIVFIKNTSLFDTSYYVYYLDVGQGDMAIIKHKNKSIMIDTGPTSFNTNYNITENNIKFLNSIGINKINLLLITHGDNDHIGNANYLVQNFKVNKVIFNCGEFNTLENKLIDILKKDNIKYYSCISKLNLDKLKLNLLNTKEYDNENDNSIVTYININNYKFLFMGDAGVDKEQDILNKYSLKNIDFLKIGHHGSNTSSGKDFIDKINPKYSLISVGKNNRYGHPKKEVLDTLKGSYIYRTDKDGTIEIKINKKGYKIKTFSP